MAAKSNDLSHLLKQVRACEICDDLPLGPSPILQLHSQSKILIVGQAPGRITHEKGIPFDDPSGNRLRDWMGLSREEFYDPKLLAILPMGFCFPGTGKGGDLPPRSECAEAWRDKLLSRLKSVELTLVIGQYALNWHLPGNEKFTLTKVVKEWRDYWPEVLPIPHPSPRNNRWLRNNPWFEEDVLPKLKQRVRSLV